MAATNTIAIVGGGLAGLAAANALARHGFTVDVFEQYPSLSEVGAGINISPQAVKALRALGVGDQVAAVANPSSGIFSCNMQTGEPIEFFDRSQAAQRYGAPFFIFHRADLLAALAGGIDPRRIHLRHRLTGLEEHAAGVSLTFENGERRNADIVIAADGIHSTVRRLLYGPDAPAYTGQMVWRALLEGRDVPADAIAPSGITQWLGPGCHLLAYYLRGKDVVNIVTQQDTEKWVEEGWSILGDPDEMRASFPDPEPKLETLLAAVTKCSKWGLFTRPLTATWARGRVLLIGDAVHAMLPNAGQGACMAFEDAYVLGRWLAARRDDHQDAFRNVQRVRVPRVHAIQRISAAHARLKHMRDRAAQKTAAKAGGNRLEWIWSYDVVAGWDQTPEVPEIPSLA